MATDYKKIAEDHENRYGWDVKHLRIYKKLYSEKTHFVYELIQNADDSGSECLKLQLDSNDLLVWNDGRQFNERDVRSICSLGSSDKDLTDIGTFGIGFKAVYNYTDFPEIYSADECFRIRDCVKPEGINEMNPKIAELVNRGKTVFCLPFKDNLHRENDIEHLKNRLCNLLKERSLLFLRCLKTFEWKDEPNDQAGSYSSYRGPFDKIQNVPENQSVELVKLTMSLDDNNESSETFLVFCKRVQPPKDVIDRLLEQAEDGEEKQRIQKSAEELQPIEVAFKLQDDRITAMDDNCVLFAYLPTQKETHLKFLIQARYQTTPPRDNIIKPSDSLWNRWLLEETADFFQEVLEHLKANDLLEPTFFNILPLKKDKVPKEFKFITEALQKAMREKAFIPTEKEGHYAKAEDVFYPNSMPLRKLVKSSGMHSDSGLLHPDIREDAKESERCFDVMAEAGVKEIDETDLLCWLEEQSCAWFKNKTNKWLCSLYIYFNRKWSKSELKRIKELPLVRLENGEHVSTSDQLVYFPPDTDEARKDIEPFLNELPILRSTLLKGKDRRDINAFLKKLGVKMLRSRSLITESICPLYRQPDKPSVTKNRWHVRYIFNFWQRAAESERIRLEKSVSKVPILRAYKGTQRKISDFVVPRNAYLPQAYMGDNDLETYFSVSEDKVWFVDDKYLTKNSDTKAWLQFLKAIGVMDMPLVIQKNIASTFENYQEFNRELAKRNVESEYTTRLWEASIEDFYLQGLSKVLDKISKHGKVDFSRIIWHLLVKIVNPLPAEMWDRDTFFNNLFQGEYHWFYRTNQRKFFDATFYRQLKSTAWIPDEQGNLHKPPECFAPTDNNREVLGDSVPYLPSNFDISTRPTQWLAEKLGVHLQADADSVLDYLQTMSQREVSVKDVEPIYKFLDSQDELLWGFEDEPFIFIPEPKPHWWRIGEVFWEDESAVFGDDRGYLRAHYSEDLKSFFTDYLEVPERADTLDYVRGIQDITLKGQAGTKEIRDRVQKLYRLLWRSLQENGDSLEGDEWAEAWEQVREECCWLGKQGNEWGFFLPQELVWKDDDYRSEFFKNEVPFWTFGNDLLDLAKELGVRGCYQDSDFKFIYSGNQEEDADWSAKVRNLVQDICDFLNSPLLCREREEEKSAKFLTQLSVRRVEKLEVKFELKGISVPDPNPRQSFLQETNQEAILWLASEANKSQYASLIGDALQEYFGDVKELSSFVEDLLTKDREDVLIRWKRKGLQTNIGVLSPEESPEEGEEELEVPVDGKITDEFDSPNADTAADEFDVGIPTDDEDNDSIADEVNESEVHSPNGEGSDSTEDKSELGTPTGDDDSSSTTNGPGTGTYNLSGTSGTRRSGGHWGGTSSGGGSGVGGHGGRGGGGEGEEHRVLKEYLADNPSQLGAGLEPGKKEHTFESGDRVDILLKDSTGKPVTVEVETHIPSGNYVGVWQAVKYQHLAAMEHRLECKQVRSILAAPEIPEDVKKKCKELGIEPIEVSNQAEDTDE